MNAQTSMSIHDTTYGATLLLLLGVVSLLLDVHGLRKRDCLCYGARARAAP